MIGRELRHWVAASLTFAAIAFVTAIVGGLVSAGP
jgi:hypothetical protein